MNCQHVQTAESADVTGIKDGRLARYSKRDSPRAAPGSGPQGASGAAEPAAAQAPPAGGRPARAPPARHGGGAALSLGLRGADRAAVPPAQRVLPGAGGARPPPAAALAQRRHLRRLAGGLRALRALRGTGPSAARARPGCAPQPVSAVAPGIPRAGQPRLAAPGAWRAAAARGKRSAPLRASPAARGRRADGCVLCQPQGRGLPPAWPGVFSSASVGL